LHLKFCCVCLVMCMPVGLTSNGFSLCDELAFGRDRIMDQAPLAERDFIRVPKLGAGPE
jgi:hypothetical protein